MSKLLDATWLADDMLRVERLMLEVAGSSSNDLVGEAASHLLKAGGKRLRPALVLLSSRVGTSGNTSTDLAAAAIELVHVATLYHDDVIDETETRRGAPTVHSKWGLEVAVLSGDYLFAKGCGLGADAGGEVPAILARAIAEVCEGQIMETTNLDDPRRTVDSYIETIRLKTAALFRAACELGASTSSSTDGGRAALTAYGENLGLAFQVVDDLIDLTGDPGVTGKEPGTDLREGVFTLPVLVAAERDPDVADALANGVRELDELLGPIERSGALDAAHDHARALCDAALAALEPLEDEDWVAVLRDIPAGVLAQA